MSIIVVSAPSGTGKTTLNRKLVAEVDQVVMSISHTTRPARAEEKHGNHYYFVDHSQFLTMIENGEFVEWAEVHGNLYGTSFAELQRIQNLGKTPLLEIDVQGWLKAKPLLSDAVSIFILPPSLKELWNRLERRGSDDLNTRWLRFNNAHQEILNSEEYDYFIVNNDIETAYQRLKSLVSNGKPEEQSSERGRILCSELNHEFENSEWISGLKAKLG